MRARGLVREEDDARKATEDKDKKEKTLEKELHNFKAFSYSQAERCEKKLEDEMLFDFLPDSRVIGRGDDDNEEESEKDKSLFKYLGVSEIYDKETEILAGFRGDVLEEAEKLESLMKMEGENLSRNALNWWLERVEKTVEMGGEIVEITDKSAKYFRDEITRLIDKWNLMFEIERSSYFDEESLQISFTSKEEEGYFFN